MTKYTLYTEDIGDLDSLVGKSFPSYSIIKQAGVWEGTKEASVQIVIISDEVLEPYKVLKLAQDIKTVNKQQAVLVTEEHINGMVI